ncbi:MULTISPECIES: DMT family transporter [unclassified Bradyrhizobium]|uniref:DMT family transporter n=1 Tax=unclassified Bradyrhizobium TaxID=2631580 RepID=UPI002916BFAF|nr:MULTISPECIES: DMT family transporter [unclassified Bradyrhizobium]
MNLDQRADEETSNLSQGSDVAIGPAAGYLLGAVLLLGVGWPISRFAVAQGASSIWLAWGRTSLSCVLTTIVLSHFRLLGMPKRSDLPAIAALGCLQIAAYFLLSYTALAWMPAGRTAILSNATTIWIAPLSIVVLKEPVSRWRWVGVAFGLLGVLIMAAPWGVQRSSQPVIVGTLYLLSAALVWALAIVLLRRSPPISSVIRLLPWSFGIASAIMLPFALSADMGIWTEGAVISLFILGGVVGPFSVYCAIQAQSRLPALVSGMGMLCCPVVGIAVASLWLGEKLSYDILFGAMFIIIGSAIGFIRAQASP